MLKQLFSQCLIKPAIIKDIAVDDEEPLTLHQPEDVHGGIY